MFALFEVCSYDDSISRHFDVFIRICVRMYSMYSKSVFQLADCFFSKSSFCVI